MRPLLLPLAQRAIHGRLERSGVTTSVIPTSLGRVRVYDGPGSGPLPTTVLLHGLSSSTAHFAPVLSRLRKRARRVVAIDYPGHGLSDDPTRPLTPDGLFEVTSAVLDHALRDEPAVLVGNSLGGAVAVDYAIKRRASVRALVLLSPAGAPTSAHEWRELQAAFTMTSRREAIAFLERVQHRPLLLTRLLAHELPAMRRRGVSEFLTSAERERGLPAEELSRLAMPILFSWGRSERLLPASHLAWWKEQLPTHAVVEQPDGMGHCPHLDDPKTVAERIASFMHDALASART